MFIPRITEERVAMIRLFSKFENTHEVQRRWGHHFDTAPPALSTILTVNQRFDETGSVEDLVARSGRPSSALTEDKLEEIKEMVTTSPNLSVREGSAQSVVSIGSYHTAMTKLHFKSYHPTLIVALNEDDFDRRSQSSEIWLEKFQNDPRLVDHIFWSDAARFDRKRVVNRRNCTYWSSENPHIKFEVPYTQEGLMVWCGLTSGGLIGPYFFNETVTGPVYKQMLVDYA